MALQPIDLQAIFTQLDKVGKTQAAQKEGVQLQAAIQAVQTQQKAEEAIQSVNETQNIGDGVEKVGDKGSSRQQAQDGKDDEAEKEKEKDLIKKRPIIRDPALGKNIDFSG